MATIQGLTPHNQTGLGVWLDQGGGGGSSDTTVAFFSSTSSRGRKFSGVKGMLFEINATGEDLQNTTLVLRFLLNGGFAATRASSGGVIRFQDTSGNQSDYAVEGSDTYDGGWKVVAVSTSKTETSNSGTPANMAAIRYAGFVVNASGASGGDDNFYIDQVLSFPDTGLTVNGTSTGFVAELVAWDQASFYGVVTSRAGVAFSLCPIILTPDAGGIASTGEILDFDDSGYYNGSAVAGALPSVGLSSVSANAITLNRFTSLAFTDTAITAGKSEKRIDFSAATNVTVNTATFQGFDATTNACRLGGSSNTYTGASFNACGPVSDTGAVNRGAFFRNAAYNSGAYIWTTSSDLANASFESKGTGYGLDIQSAPTDPLTTDLDGITAVNYGADDTADAFAKNNTGHAVILSIVNGGTNPTVDATSDTTTQQNVLLQFEGCIVGKPLRVTREDTGAVLIDRIATATTETESFNYPGSTVNIRVRHRSSSPGDTISKAYSQVDTVRETGLIHTINFIPDSLATG